MNEEFKPNITQKVVLEVKRDSKLFGSAFIAAHKQTGIMSCIAMASP